MRLTLRTLLAYLDDTLPAAEIKGIGQKVAESDAAQELIARIKQVTRRRRLTTPPMTGPKARFDANDVADYLSDTLPAERVVELEKTCLESDVHLAELAACHQILTLVLGEPALVPPTAKERMYGLVEGREAIPFRKAPTATPARADGDGADDDDLLALPFLRRGPWLRWALPVAGLLLVVALGVAVWQIGSDGNEPLARNHKKGEEVAVVPTPPPVVTPEAPPKKEPIEKKKAPDETIVPPPGPPEVVPPPKPVEDDGPTIRKAPPPSMERVAFGTHIARDRDTTALLARAADSTKWKRVAPGARVSTSDTLMSLPGFSSDIKTPGGVTVTLHGNLPEYAPAPVPPLMTFLNEASVVLHKNSDFDLDIALDRGRVYLVNNKRGEAKVRLRFADEVWDVTLEEPGAEVVVDLLRHFTRDINWRTNEEPRAQVFFGVVSGQVALKITAFGETYAMSAPKGRALFLWDNFRRSSAPVSLEKRLAEWDREPPFAAMQAEDAARAKRMTRAVKGLGLMLSSAAEPHLALHEAIRKEDASEELRGLVIYCLGAIDDVDQVIGALSDEDLTHAADRGRAVFSLRRWISRSAHQGRLLFDEKTRTGALIKRGFRVGEAETIYDLLHDFRDEDRRNALTFETLALYMESNKIAIAELAYWHLVRLAYPTRAPNFNAALPLNIRKMAAGEVRNLIQMRKLPPPPPAERKGP